MRRLHRKQTQRQATLWLSYAGVSIATDCLVIVPGYNGLVRFVQSGSSQVEPGTIINRQLNT
jgi:hypothetical protein